MEIICFFCQLDLASKNIWENILKDFQIEETSIEFDGLKVYRYKTTNATFWLARTRDYIYKNGLYYSELTSKFSPKCDLAAIVGFHEGKSGPILTLHSIGEPSSHDGLYTPKYTLAKTSCKAIKNILLGFKKYINEFNLIGFDVTQEATHGSPVDFDIPIIDVEIGSTTKEYEDPIAGKVLAHSIFHMNDDLDFVPAIGFGGLHYADKFADVNLNGRYGVGHILPSVSLCDFNKEIFRQTIEKTIEKPQAVVIDKKEKGEYKNLAREFATEFGLQVINHNQAAQ